MRHLFFVHSAITYLVAGAVMRHEHLVPADCAYLLLRGFQPDPTDPVTDRLALPALVTVPLTWRIGQTWRAIDQLDAQVARLLGGADFALYVPHLDNPTARLLYTHPRCRQVSYLEEGTASYVPQVPPLPAWCDRVLRRWVSRGRLPALGPFPDVHRAAYCLDALCFPGIARKVVLPLPFRRVSVVPSPADHVVLVFDALIEFNLVEPEAFCQALHELFGWLAARGHRRVLYKYHPVQARDAARRAYYEEAVFGPWRDRLTFAELTAPASLEDIAFSYPSTEFAIIVSSVGLYARICGRRVVSVAQRLAALDARFAARLAQLPAAVFAGVEFVPAVTDAPA